MNCCDQALFPSLRRHYPVQVQTVGGIWSPPSQPKLVGLPFTSILALQSWQTADVDSKRHRLQAAHLYLVCDDRPDRFLAAALRGGVDIVQLRIKDGADDAILAAARRFKAACDAHDALFILNDRPDLVRAADADGVHVGQDDTAVTQARELVGPDRLVGLSTHSPAQIEAAGATDVDYIGVGPVHETPTKPGRPAVGFELVRYAASNTPVPFFAIGGISTANVSAVAAAGATRIAVVRALTDAADPERVATELRGAVDRTGARVGST
jgi:thiamine-phosphate pyrophosphorylase